MVCRNNNFLQVHHQEWEVTNRNNNIRHISKTCIINSSRVHLEWDIRRIFIMIKVSCNNNNNSSSNNTSPISNSSNHNSNRHMANRSMSSHNIITLRINSNINSNNSSRRQ